MCEQEADRGENEREINVWEDKRGKNVKKSHFTRLLRHCIYFCQKIAESIKIATFHGSMWLCHDHSINRVVRFRMHNRRDHVFILNKRIQSLAGRCTYFFKGGTNKTISNEAYSIPTVVFNFWDIKPFEILTKGMGLHPRETYITIKTWTVLGIRTLYTQRIPLCYVLYYNLTF